MSVEFSGPKGLFCVYCLFSEGEKSKGRCYIGYTPTPKRRLRQHNGEIAGGARRTKRNGPWRMGCFVYGFPNKISGLKFEFAWTYPKKSKYVGVLRSPRRRLVRPLMFNYAMDTLATLLATPFYINQPLGINFLHYDLFMKYKALFKYHEVRYEPVFTTKKGVKTQCDQIYQFDETKRNNDVKCDICAKNLDPCRCNCYVCDAQFCMMCLATHMTQNTTQLIPTEGMCYKCKAQLQWKVILQQTSLQLQNQLSNRPEETNSSFSSSIHGSKESEEDETLNNTISNFPDNCIRNTPENPTIINKEQEMDISSSIISID